MEKRMRITILLFLLTNSSVEEEKKSTGENIKPPEPSLTCLLMVSVV